MAKNVTINFNTAFNANGIKSAIYSLQEMQTVTKNVQQSLEGARTKWAQSAAAFETTISTVERLNGMLMSMASAYEETELNATRLDVGNEAAYEGHQRPSGSCQGADLAI